MKRTSALVAIIAITLLLATAQTPDPPFTKAKIIKGLELGVTNKRMAALVNERGVDFSLTSEIEKELRQAGAGEELIEAIRTDNLAHKHEIKLTAGTTKINPKDDLTYVWIPLGAFQMGCSADDNECYENEKPAHAITITKGFWLGQTPVTQAAYRRVMGANPSEFRGDQLPVANVNWHQAKPIARL
jgi:formylglycine-generating enzyme required for sulfatase activity